MSDEMIPPKRTRLTRRQARDALLDAFAKVTGEIPSPETLAILVAQTALETGQWRSIWNYNFGNIRGQAPPPGGWTSFRAGEIIDGKEVFLEPGPHNKFRAYATAEDGARGFVEFLGVDSNGDGHNRYGKAWKAALEGDPEKFSLELANAGYYTANPTRYTKTLLALFRQFLPYCREATMTGERLDAMTARGEQPTAEEIEASLDD